MRFYIKNIYLILIIIISFLNANEAFAKENKIKYYKKDISNYFSGTLSSKYGDYIVIGMKIDRKIRQKINKLLPDNTLFLI